MKFRRSITLNKAKPVVCVGQVVQMVSLQTEIQIKSVSIATLLALNVWIWEDKEIIVDA